MQPHHIHWFPVPLKAALLSSLGHAAMLSEAGLLGPLPLHFFLVPTQCSALRSLEKIPSVLHGDEGSWAERGVRDFLTDSFILESLSQSSGLAQLGVLSWRLFVISLGPSTSSQFNK